MERNDFLEKYIYNDSDRFALAEQVAKDHRKAIFFLDKIKLEAVLDALLVGMSHRHPDDPAKRLWDYMEGVVLIPESVLLAGMEQDTDLQARGIEREFNFEVQIKPITNPKLSGVQLGSWIDDDEMGYPDPDDTVVYYRITARPHLYVTEKFNI